MSGRNLAEAAENRAARQWAPVNKDLVQRYGIDFRGDARVSQQSFYLGCEKQRLTMTSIEERPDSQPVPAQQKGAAARVPDRKRELPIDPLETVNAELLITV